jgi:hypothetical protein
MKTERRSVLKKLVASIVGVVGIGMTAKADVAPPSPEKEVGKITEFHLLVEQAWEMATNLEKKDSTSS